MKNMWKYSRKNDTKCNTRYGFLSILCCRKIGLLKLFIILYLVGSLEYLIKKRITCSTFVDGNVVTILCHKTSQQRSDLKLKLTIIVWNQIWNFMKFMNMFRYRSGSYNSDLHWRMRSHLEDFFLCNKTKGQYEKLQ